MRIALASILVDDQEKAKDFYTGILGFQVKTDASYGPGRWLTVVSADAPEGTELHLGLPDEAGFAFQKAKREQGKPAIALTTDDCHRDFELLTSRGVRFTMKPAKLPYGGTDAVFDDTCGNLIALHQE